MGPGFESQRDHQKPPIMGGFFLTDNKIFKNQRLDDGLPRYKEYSTLILLK